MSYPDRCAMSGLCGKVFIFIAKYRVWWNTMDMTIGSLAAQEHDNETVTIILGSVLFQFRGPRHSQTERRKKQQHNLVPSVFRKSEFTFPNFTIIRLSHFCWKRCPCTVQSTQSGKRSLTLYCDLALLADFRTNLADATCCDPTRLGDLLRSFGR